jgi:predicted pyridoxine 5'-phosphate oxidase superfamily flavin-nucleotide-binding protein
MTYHDGELAMQERAGVRDLANQVGRIIGSDFSAGSAAFVAARTFVITSTIAQDGTVTASIVGGRSGFAQPSDPHTLIIAPSFGLIDAVMEDVVATGIIGVLAIDFAARRRVRINGTAQRDGERIVVTTREVYANCPQYIRHRVPGEEVAAANIVRQTATALNARQRATIEATETFFIATAHPDRGADASHRGGPAGFVKAESVQISWPDYPGNNMFNTLGNLLVAPRCGVIFVDFDRGSTLQLSGDAIVRGEKSRMVELSIAVVIETSGAMPLRFFDR